MFTLTIETDNSAFEDSPQDEIARILRAAAQKLEGCIIGNPDTAPLFDVNGNRVGKWEFN